MRESAHQHRRDPATAPEDPAPGAADARDEETTRALRDAERRAAEAAQHYQDLADMLPALIGETDAKGRLTYVNRYGLELTGYGDDEWRGLPIAKVLAPADRPRAMANFGRRMAGGDLPPSTYDILHRDGVTLLPVELRATNIVRGGRVVGLRCVLFDLRERLAAERDRLQFEQRALEARRLESLGVLAGGVAHDFNNLLAVVLGNADLALLELPPEARARPRVRDIWVAAQRASALTRQLLAYTGKAAFHRTTVDANGLVRDALAQLPGGVDDPRIALALGDDLAPVRGDRGHLAQVMQNLVANALEALPPGRGSVALETQPVDVTATAQPTGLRDPDQLAPGPYVRCRVRDDGVGMDAATVARMFEPFFTTKFTGRGLGLSVVIGVTRSHGGGIAVTSQPGRGTVVDLYLPVAPTRAERGDDPDDIAGLRGRALIVDPEPDLAQVLARILTRLGLEAETTRDTVEAARTILSTPFDVVLVASRGEAKDERLLRRMTAVAPELPLVLYGAGSERSTRARRVGFPVAAHLDKPFDVRAVASVLGALLGA